MDLRCWDDCMGSAALNQSRPFPLTTVTRSPRLTRSTLGVGHVLHPAHHLGLVAGRVGRAFGKKSGLPPGLGRKAVLPPSLHVSPHEVAQHLPDRDVSTNPDVPHLAEIEAAVRGTIDVLLGRGRTGKTTWARWAIERARAAKGAPSMMSDGKPGFGCTH